MPAIVQPSPTETATPVRHCSRPGPPAAGCLGEAHADGVVVGPPATTAQDEVAEAVAAGAHDRGAAVPVDAEEAVRVGRRLDRVDGDLEAAVGAVLEADGRGQAARHLAVGLRFGRARADGVPADEVAEVLGGHRVECLGAGRQAHLGEVEKQASRPLDALVYTEGIVHVRVVDVALPPSRGAWLLEVDAHHQDLGVRHLGGDRLRRVAYSWAAAGSWIEHGPSTTNSRGSRRSRMSRSTERPRITVASAAALSGRRDLSWLGVGISSMPATLRSSTGTWAASGSVTGGSGSRRGRQD